MPPADQGFENLTQITLGKADQRLIEQFELAVRQTVIEIAGEHQCPQGSFLIRRLRAGRGCRHRPGYALRKRASSKLQEVADDRSARLSKDWT